MIHGWSFNVKQWNMEYIWRFYISNSYFHAHGQLRKVSIYVEAMQSTFHIVADL